MRPASIVYFERLYWAAILVGLVNTFIGWNDTVATVRAQPGADLGQGFVIGITVAGVLIQLLLWFLIARQPKMPAKWAFVLLFALTVVLTLPSLSLRVHETVVLALTLVSLVLRALATWMLFRSDTRAWFASAGTP